MADPLRFLIIDGYPEDARGDLKTAGMQLAWKLYANMLQQHAPDATYAVWLPSDTDSLPDGVSLDAYDGIIWTGCNLTIYDDEPRVTRQIDLAKQAFKVGVPSFGSCWGVQMAAVAAGGEVKANPKGREMGLARKIHLTAAGREHPMLTGKPAVFDAFISHVDEITGIPSGATVLAGNDFTHVQALSITHGKGTFWATQYHPEYDLHEMARLIVARESKLVPLGFFTGHEDLTDLVDRMEALAAKPDKMSLRWQLAIDDDVLSDTIRQCEFVNWINRLVIPHRAGARDT